MNATKQATSMKESTEKEKLAVRAFTNGPTEKNTTENGSRVLKKATVSGKEFTKTLMLASGNNQKRKALECISGRTETNMKESGKIV